MYQDPYHFPQQGAYLQDNSWLNGNFDFITKIMSFSFIASLFNGFAGGERDGSGGTLGTGGSGSYVWNTISLFLLGLFVETGRRFCQWIIQRVKFRQHPYPFSRVNGPAEIISNRILDHCPIYGRRCSLRVDNPLPGTCHPYLSCTLYHLTDPVCLDRPMLKYGSRPENFV